MLTRAHLALCLLVTVVSLRVAQADPDHVSIAFKRRTTLAALLANLEAASGAIILSDQRSAGLTVDALTIEGPIFQVLTEVASRSKLIAADLGSMQGKRVLAIGNAAHIRDSRLTKFQTDDVLAKRDRDLQDSNKFERIANELKQRQAARALARAKAAAEAQRKLDELRARSSRSSSVARSVRFNSDFIRQSNPVSGQCFCISGCARKYQVICVTTHRPGENCYGGTCQ
jgi:hypothetical protein